LGAKTADVSSIIDDFLKGKVKFEENLCDHH